MWIFEYNIDKENNNDSSILNTKFVTHNRQTDRQMHKPNLSFGGEICQKLLIHDTKYVIFCIFSRLI